jgi:epoxyqueuosine reductase
MADLKIGGLTNCVIMFSFLLHVCCAPCSIAVIDELKNKFKLTVFFYNPNIYPEEEYLKRKNDVIKICREWNVPVIDMDYEADKWRQIAARGFENEPEGGLRCLGCFRLRLAKTAEYAGKNSFEYFGSSLTSGRNKKAEIINSIGRMEARRCKVMFYEADWKKGGRQEQSDKLIKSRGLYRQDYCGCVYSLKFKIGD